MVSKFVYYHRLVRLGFHFPKNQIILNQLPSTWKKYQLGSYVIIYKHMLDGKKYKCDQEIYRQNFKKTIEKNVRSE